VKGVSLSFLTHQANVAINPVQLPKAHSARSDFLGPGNNHFSLTGQGVRVLILDDGISSTHAFGGRLKNLASMQGNTPEPRGGDAHALRIASICAEGHEAIDLPGGPLGIAPRVEVLSALYAPLFCPIIPGALTELMQQVKEEHGPIDILAFPCSIRENHWLAHKGRAEFAAIAELSPGDSTLVVAAAGHDPVHGVRFPASSESVIAVGVCDDNSLPTGFCGVSASARKPELLIPNREYMARLENGQLGKMGGTSAGVAIVSGLAALWIQRLRNDGIPVSAPLLRAVLLGSSPFSSNGSHRITNVSSSPIAVSQFHASEEWLFDSTGLKYVVNSACGGIVRIAIVCRRRQTSISWIPRLPEVSITIDRRSRRSEELGYLWCVAEIEVHAGETFEVLVNSSEHLQSMAVFMSGATASLSSKAPRRAKRPRTVVGISASHDASACVMQNGQVKAGIQLERLTRKKRDGTGFLNSREAIDYCLQSLGLTVADVDLFVFNAQPLLPGWVGLSQPCADENFDVFDPFGERALFISHHLAHAFSAFAHSPFSDATVFVADGSGGSTIGAKDLLLAGPDLKKYICLENNRRPPIHVQSTYLFSRDGFRLVDRETSDSFNTRCGSTSLGEVYAAVSQYIFNGWQEGGKLMGLAPYGHPDECGPSFLARDDLGRLQFAAHWKNFFCRTAPKSNVMEYRHLAARIQRDLEEAILERVRRALEMTQNRRLAYAGGIALNSVVNERILRETSVKDFFVLPASNDAGIALGAAAAGEFQLTKSTLKPAKTYSDFLGYPYSDDDCLSAIKEYRSRLIVKEVELSVLADRLLDGAIIGWFEGGSEFGPRALGHRSILADPRQRATWRRINTTVKYREDFRPLAPIVPEELASRFFDIEIPSPYMLRVVKVRREFRESLGAVCHVDGSARVQTLRKEQSPRLHALLMAINTRNGLPILVNTSMNVRGQPMVETPLEAIQLLLSTELDSLVIGSFLVSPKAAPSGALALTDRIALSPYTRVVHERSANGLMAAIVAEARSRVSYAIHGWCFNVLANADGRTSLLDLFEQHLPSDVTPNAALAYLTPFFSKRLVHICSDD
jgi:carbamoyltransferase